MTASMVITPKPLNTDSIHGLCNSMSNLTITASSAPMPAKASSSNIDIEKLAKKTAELCVNDIDSIFTKNRTSCAKQSSKDATDLIKIPVKVTLGSVELAQTYTLNPALFLKDCTNLLQPYQDKVANNPAMVSCIDKIMEATATRINEKHPLIGLLMASCEPKLAKGYQHSVALQAVATNIVVSKFPKDIIARFS